MKVMINEKIDVPVWVFVTGLEGAEQLIELDTAERYDAVSGPHGRGELPKGQYAIHQAVELDASEDSSKPYTDRSGFAWFAKLQPAFDTERSGFGIHPDGNVPGTLGCVGISGIHNNDTRALFEKLRKRPAVLMVV